MTSISPTSAQGPSVVDALQDLDLTGVPVLVVGAGIMGAGIAQVAAQAGHHVYLYDTQSGAAESAVSKLRDTLEVLEAKGKLGGRSAQDIASRITPTQNPTEASSAGLVIEAIVEKLEAKRSLFQSLENIVGETCVLATNTSSISVTAIGNGFEISKPSGGDALFQSSAAHEAGGGRVRFADESKRGGSHPSAEYSLGQDTCICEIDSWLHRQPNRAPLLCRSTSAATGASM